MGWAEAYVAVPDDMKSADYQAVAFAEGVKEAIRSLQDKYGIVDEDMSQCWDVLMQALKRSEELGEQIGMEALKAAERIVEDENHASEVGSPPRLLS